MIMILLHQIVNHTWRFLSLQEVNQIGSVGMKLLEMKFAALAAGLDPELGTRAVSSYLINLILRHIDLDLRGAPEIRRVSYLSC